MIGYEKWPFSPIERLSLFWAWLSGVASGEALAAEARGSWAEPVVSHGGGSGGSGSNAVPDPAGE